MVLKTHMKLCVTESDLPEKKILSKEYGKCAQNGPKTLFFEFIGKFGH